MALRVYTARLPHHRQPGYVGPDALDISRGSGGGAGDPFAPSRALLNAANACKRRLRGRDQDLDFLFAWYRELYVEEMRDSYRRHYAAWRALLARPSVVLCCYCGSARCHRRLLADILVRLGAVDGGELTAAGAAAQDQARRKG
jgi:uncharacterized protein YeaO (DUF488 family)